jgi:hypothetical protein
MVILRVAPDAAFAGPPANVAAIPTAGAVSPIAPAVSSDRRVSGGGDLSTMGSSMRPSPERRTSRCKSGRIYLAERAMRPLANRLTTFDE